MSAGRANDPLKVRSLPIAARVALAFGAVGALWIVTTDFLLYRFISNPSAVSRIETAKGWLFIAVAAAFLYWIVDRSVGRLARSDATLHAVIESVADGVLTVGVDHTIASANPAAARMLGIEHPEQLVGMGPEELTRRFNVSLPDGHLMAADELISQRVLKGDVPPPYKAIIHPPSRPEVIAIVTAAPVRHIPTGPVALAVSVIHDVTALEQLDRMREQFVSACAHSLRTPVTIIKGYVHLLSTPGGRVPVNGVQAIERQCGKIVRLTENLLVLARVRSNSLRLHLEPVACAELVEEATRDMKTASADHELMSRLDARPMIFADRERLGLVIRNLIEIAYRCSRPHTDVTVEVAESDARARVGVSYEPLLDEELVGTEGGAGYTGLGLERNVIECVAKATRGTLGSAQDDRPRRTEWIELPTMLKDA